MAVKAVSIVVVNCATKRGMVALREAAFALRAAAAAAVSPGAHSAVEACVPGSLTGTGTETEAGTEAETGSPSGPSDL